MTTRERASTTGASARDVGTTTRPQGMRARQTVPAKSVERERRCCTERRLCSCRTLHPTPSTPFPVVLLCAPGEPPNKGPAPIGGVTAP
eukprot:49209-Alexandrium_andersonii.AAC.1